MNTRTAMYARSNLRAARHAPPAPPVAPVVLPEPSAALQAALDAVADAFDDCSMCGEPGTLLGASVYRCRACGWTWGTL